MKQEVKDFGEFIRQSYVVTPLGLTEVPSFNGMLGTGKANLGGVINDG